MRRTRWICVSISNSNARQAIRLSQLRRWWRYSERAWRAQDPPLISSFDHAALAAVRKAAPDLPVAVVTPTLADEWREAFETLGAAALHVGDRGLAADPVRQLTAEGIEIGVYTVNDGGRARDLFSWGVTGVFSDCPGAIAAAL